MKVFPVSKTYKLLEPSPVVFVTTAHKGRANIMTMSWLTPLEFTPALIGCVISELNYSHKAVRATGECVIAIPTVDLAAKVVDVGNCCGEDLDKFEAFGLTPVPAGKVAPPLVAECLANLECRVADTRMVRKYNFFVLEAVQAWIDPKRRERRTIHHNGDGTFVVDGRTINLQKRMVKWSQFLD